MKPENSPADACLLTDSLQDLEAQRCADLAERITRAEQLERGFARAAREAYGRGDEQGARLSVVQSAHQRQLRDCLQEELYLRRRLQELAEREAAVLVGMVRGEGY